jgi:predicted thioesterase
MPAAKLTAGLRGTATVTVSEKDTVTAHGSGSVPVLATPRQRVVIDEARFLQRLRRYHPLT